MLSYYRSIIDVNDKCIIYNALMNDDLRSKISRWRLSNHKLYIETGRYSVPKIKREDRKCQLCGTVEDEYHAVFICPKFKEIRLKYVQILNKYRDIHSFLNPAFEDAVQVAIFIKEMDSKLLEL